MNILIADDDSSWVEPFSSIVRSRHRIDVAPDGVEALAKFIDKKKGYDVVVTDVMMPKLNGISLLKEIRMLDESIPVIVITGYPNEQLEREASFYNPYAFFTKPLDAILFLETLDIIETDLSKKIRSSSGCESK